MELNEVLIDLFGRVGEHVHEAVEGLDAEMLRTPPEPGTNPIGWLIWHVARGEDYQIAEVSGQEQVWTKGDWARSFGVTPDPNNMGYGHSWPEVMAIRPDSADALIDYYDAVAARTRPFLEKLTPKDLDGIVDRNWDPPVTMGVRLISIADDEIQHSGQAVYARGMLERRR
ncbi:MAG TPA: DinB family protein [Ilumatobacteraceae bacterium]|nr:DinB family protein [Ilumatobacteraceae bacterium]